MTLDKTILYVLSSEERQRGFAYSDQTIQVRQGNKVLYKAIISEDIDSDVIVGVEEIPIKNYVVDATREEELLRSGYYGKDVITTREFYSRVLK